MNTDIIGRLYDVPQDAEQDPIELPGWHVNLTPESMRDEWAKYLVEPSPLRRVWAGDDPYGPVLTVPLRFEDEAQAKKVLGY